MVNFSESFAEIQEQEKALKAKKEQARNEVITHIRELMKMFDIKAEELAPGTFIRQRPFKSRGSAPVKYRFPNGVEWTGRGTPKKDVVAYLESVGKTLDDKWEYLIDEDEKAIAALIHQKKA